MKRRMVKIITRQVYAGDNFRLYEFEKRGKAFAAEIHWRMPNGRGRMAYIDGAGFDDIMQQTHVWATCTPSQSEVEEYLERIMLLAPNYPLEVH